MSKVKAKLRRVWDTWRFSLASQGVFLVPVQASRVRLTAQGPREETVVWLAPPTVLRVKRQ